MAGRFGQYITDGTTNATVPKTEDGMTISLADAGALINARAAMPPKPGKKPVKKAAPKKAAPKKAGLKKAVTQKAGPEQDGAKKPVAQKKPPTKKPPTKKSLAG
jgi:DNA topoisomerase-1